MACNRFETDGMRLLDGELNAEETKAYEAHVKGCEECARELKDLGRIVNFTNELRLGVPDQEFWDGYWRSVYRGLTCATLIVRATFRCWMSLIDFIRRCASSCSTSLVNRNTVTEHSANEHSYGK